MGLRGMKDNFGRNIDYMRVSITDRCNLRCRYCMPEGARWVPMSEILTYEQIIEICTEAATLGIRKLKVTGGEPLVRRGCPELIRRLKEIPGIQQVTMTTNGVLLSQYMDVLLRNGLDGVNISLDTLDRERYAWITGSDSLDEVLDSIMRALKSGIKVKINSVLFGDEASDEWKSLVLMAKERNIDVRFIELMPIGYGKTFEPISNSRLMTMIRQLYPGIETDESVHGNGPAVYYKIPGFKGSIGFISPIHGKFCHQCNRLRLTSKGILKPCLCYGEGIDLKSVFERKGEKKDDIRRAIRQGIEMKPEGHCFEKKESITENKNMIQIGG